MRKILIYICILSQSIAFGQQKSKGFSNFFIGGGIFRTSVILINDNYPKPANSKQKHTISGNQSYSVLSGIDFRFPSNYKIRLEGAYERLKYNENVEGLLFGTDGDPLTGLPKTSSTLRTIHTLNNLNLGLFLLRNHGKNKRFYTGLGVSTHFKIYEARKSAFYYGNGDIEDWNSGKVETNKGKFDDVSFELFEGYHLFFNNSLRLSLQPFIQFRLKKRIIDDFDSIGNKLSYGAKAIIDFKFSDKEAKCYKF